MHLKTNTSRFRHTQRRSQGVVMVIALLSIFLLLGLILYVLNLGQQVNHRIQVQNSADATVEAAAKWSARQMNTVSRHNSAIARYLAAVNVLDAAPQAAEFTLLEHEAFRDLLVAQLSRSMGTSPASLYRLIDDLLQEFLAEIEDEIADLRPVVDLFRSLDIEEMTHYNNGNGYLWQGMYAMDEMNQAILANYGDMIQHAAMANARANRQGGSSTVLLPLDPQLPHFRGRFDDFEIPVRRGMLPDHLDDRANNRGPWDTIYGWRDVLGYYEGGTFVPGSISNAGGSSGKAVGLSRGPGGGGNGRMVGQTFVPTGYATYGPYSWMLRRFSAYIGQRLQNTRMDWYLRRVGDRKLSYLWPNPLPPLNAPPASAVIRPDTGTHFNNPNGSRVRDIILPDWRTNFEEAVAIAEAGTPEIKETAFIVVEIKSRYAPDDPGFLTPGSWTTVTTGSIQDSPRLTIVDGWQDPRRWGVEQTGNWVWRDDWQYEVYGDSSIGIRMPPPPANPPANYQAPTQTVYRVDHFVFVGVNVGNPADVTNPYEGFNPSDERAPAPMNLDQNLVGPEPSKRFNYQTYMAVVKRNDEPQTWGTRFRGGKPYNNVVAIAQAKVFNNHSWDLWTQMWYGQIEPVSNYQLWIDRFSQSPGQGATDAGVSQQDITELQQYLDSLSTLAPAMLNH